MGYSIRIGNLDTLLRLVEQGSPGHYAPVYRYKNSFLVFEGNIIWVIT